MAKHLAQRFVDLRGQGLTPEPLSKLRFNHVEGRFDIAALVVDTRSPVARLHFDSAKANFYTTNLVLAETVRQIAKEGGVDWVTKTRRFGRCDELLIDSGRIFVCAPPREVILQAYDELKDAWTWSQSLDLCDILSVTVLNYAHHGRVFSFDNDFKQFGAKLEP